MATGAKKPAVVASMPAAAAAAANARQHHQKQQQALFEAKHAELLSEASGVAREFAVDVCAVAFRPDGTAARHDFLGVGPEARLEDSIRRAVARDVSAMGPEEVAAHEQQLRRLRALVARELQAKPAKANKQAADGAKRSPEQQEMAGAAAGSGDKIRKE